jgi:hypothetical protein
MYSYTELNAKYKATRESFTTFNGETRESYLEWRSNWRASYAELSKFIRTLKYNRKIVSGLSDADRETCTFYASIFSKLATQAIDIRVESKQTARENYLKMKEKVTL